MKRALALLSLPTIAALAINTAADAQSSPVRASTQQVTSQTLPTRDRTRPYTFTTTGRVVPPPFCAAGDPGTPGGRCVPLLCPAAPAAYSYCIPPPRRALCSGNVNIRFKKVGGAYTISSRAARVRADCTFRSRVSFRTPNPLRRGTLVVRTRFEGNAFLLPRNAPSRTVRAG